jgi:hypothetical protein
MIGLSCCALDSIRVPREQERKQTANDQQTCAGASEFTSHIGCEPVDFNEGGELKNKNRERAQCSTIRLTVKMNLPSQLVATIGVWKRLDAIGKLQYRAGK